MKTLHRFAILIAVACLSSARAETTGANKLAAGTEIPHLQLKNGRDYQNVTITKIDDEGVSIRHEAGLARIRFDQFSDEYQESAKTLEKAAEGPPQRFNADTLSFFSAVSSQYWHNGDPVKGPADPQPALSRLANSADPLLKDAVRVALALVANQKNQETQGRSLDAKMKGLVPGVQGEILSQGVRAATAPWHVTGYMPDGQPVYEQETVPLDETARGLEASMGGANTQAALNRMSELNLESLVLGGQLREKVAAISRRDLPKSATVPSPFGVEFVKPGFLAITNRSGKTLHRCLFATATTMHTPRDESGHQALANVLNQFAGFSGELSRESARQTALRAELAGAGRGYVIYAPVLRDQETVTIPFCDMPSLPAASAVRLSAWTDEFTGENAPVAGLQAFKDVLEREARARWERQHAPALRKANSPLHNGNRVNLQPKIPRNPNNPLHQGNGARIFDR